LIDFFVIVKYFTKPVDRQHLRVHIFPGIWRIMNRFIDSNSILSL